MTPLGYDQAPPRAKLALLASLALVACASAQSPPDRETEVAEPTRELVDGARGAEAARRYDRATELYERARRAAPDPRSRAFASREFGRALAFWGEDERAAAALEDAVACDPDLADAWHDLGILRHRLGRPEAAERALRRAAALRPDDPRPKIALAAIFVNARRFDEAQELYRELLDLDLPESLREAIVEAQALIKEEQAR